MIDGGARAFLRKNAFGFGLELLVNVALPFAVYSYAQPKIGDVNALLASMAPPIGWSVLEFVRKRRVDFLSVFIVISIALSLLAFIGGGSVRFLQLRENYVTGLIGLGFLVSAIAGKPLVYQFARAGMARQSPAKTEAFEALSGNIHFRRSMTTMTLVWGFGLIAQTIVACLLVFTMSIQAYLVVNPILGYASMAALGIWTFWYGKRQERIGNARRAAEAAAAANAEHA